MNLTNLQNLIILISFYKIMIMMKSKISAKIASLFLFVFLFLLCCLFIQWFGKYVHIPCVFHKLTGLLCPGCGMTRSIIAISNGNLLKAIRYNFLIVLLIPLFSIYAFYNIYHLLEHKKLVSLSKFYPQKLTLFFLIFCLVYGIVRNIFKFYQI